MFTVRSAGGGSTETCGGEGPAAGRGRRSVQGLNMTRPAIAADTCMHN